MRLKHLYKKPYLVKKFYEPYTIRDGIIPACSDTINETKNRVIFIKYLLRGTVCRGSDLFSARRWFWFVEPAEYAVHVQQVETEHEVQQLPSQNPDMKGSLKSNQQ